MTAPAALSSDSLEKYASLVSVMQETGRPSASRDSWKLSCLGFKFESLPAFSEDEFTGAFGVLLGDAVKGVDALDVTD